MVPMPARAVSLKAASVHGTIVIVRNYLCEIIDGWRVKVQLNFFFPFGGVCIFYRMLYSSRMRRM